MKYTPIRSDAVLKFIENGMSITRASIQAGMAWRFVKYSKDGAYLNAQKARQGLWAETNPVAPWEWRKRESPRQAPK